MLNVEDVGMRDESPVQPCILMHGSLLQRRVAEEQGRAGPSSRTQSIFAEGVDILLYQE